MLHAAKLTMLQIISAKLSLLHVECHIYCKNQLARLDHDQEDQTHYVNL